MKKLLLFILPPIFASIIFFGITLLFVKNGQGEGALQVTSTPSSSVYLDGKFIGKTPLCKCELRNMLPTGDHMIRLVPEGNEPFEQKITIIKTVMTVVDRSFSKEGAQGSIINLYPLKDTKTAEVFVASFPDKAKVFLDKNLSGETSLLLKDVTDSDHELSLEKDGYQKKVIHMHTVKGYRLSAVVTLGIRQNLSIDVGAPAASISAAVTPTSSTPHVTILETPTGFLRVRADASLSASETARVNPGLSFELLDEKNGWYQIKLPNGQTGWVSNQYAKKQ